MTTVNINIWTSFNPSYIVLDYFNTNFLEPPRAHPRNPIFLPTFCIINHKATYKIRLSSVISTTLKVFLCPIHFSKKTRKPVSSSFDRINEKMYFLLSFDTEVGIGFSCKAGKKEL